MTLRKATKLHIGPSTHQKYTECLLPKGQFEGYHSVTFSPCFLVKEGESHAAMVANLSWNPRIISP